MMEDSEREDIIEDDQETEGVTQELNVSEEPDTTTEEQAGPQTPDSNGYFYNVEVEDEQSDDEPKNSKKSSIVLIVSIVCLVLAIAIIAIIVLRKDEEGNSATDSETSQTASTDVQAGSQKDEGQQAVASTEGQKTKEPVEYEDYGVTVELGDYKNITVEYPQFTVSEEDIDLEVEDFLDVLKEYKDVTDRPAQMGDFLEVDYDGVVDGKHNEKTTGTDLSVQLGSGSTIDGFEDGLVGTRVGDTVVLNLKFPEVYDPEFAGKDVEFTLTVKSLREEIAPELTDELIAANTEYKTIDEYRESIRKDLMYDMEQEAENRLLEDAQRKLVEISTYGGGIDKEIADRVEYLKNYYNQYFMSMVGMSAQDYYGFSDDEYTDMMHSMADFEAKRPYALSAIAQKEGYVPTQEEKDAEFAEIFYDVYGFEDEEEVYESFTRNYCDTIVLNELTAQHGLDWLEENMIVTGRPE